MAKLIDTIEQAILVLEWEQKKRGARVGDVIVNLREALAEIGYEQKRDALVSAAAEASEVFGDDELERSALTSRGRVA